MKSKLLIFLPVLLTINMFYGFTINNDKIETRERKTDETFIQEKHEVISQPESQDSSAILMESDNTPISPLVRNMSATSSICVIAGQWVPSGTYPDVPSGSFYGASVWLDDTLYHHKPSPNGGASNAVIQYTWNGTWILASGNNLPFVRTGMALVAAGGKLYSIGGSSGSITGGPFHNSLILYDPAEGRWILPVLEPMPLALTGHSAVAWGDSVIFVIGGPWNFPGTHLDVYYYRIASNTWGTISNSLPAGEGRRSFGLGIVGNKIIISGGFNTEYLKSTWVGTIGSDASSITWEAAPDIPLPSNITGLSRCGAATYDDFFFLVNGEKGGTGGYYDTTHIFSVSLNQWVGMITDIPFKRSNIFNNVTAKCIDDTVSLFIPGGFGSVTGEPPGEGTDRFDVTRIGFVVPVELTSFTVSVIQNKVTLNWTTATESNNYGFEIERKATEQQFTKIGFVPGYGTTSEAKNYSFADNSVTAGSYTYRLKQVDFDGTFEYSNEIEVEILAPNQFSLEQNYPNPFNPSTKITFSLPEASQVKLSVFNILGEEVKTLLNETIDAGIHIIDFDAGEFSSGVYLYKIQAVPVGSQAGNFVQVRKMILTK
jgi:hypothetical protein